MPNPTPTTRAAKLIDIPLVRRLAEKGIVLDSELAFTRTVGGPNSAVLASILLPQRGLHTVIAGAGSGHVVGQFRLKPSEHLAQIVYIAPRLDDETPDTCWLHVLDGMAAEAGRRGAHMLTAEVDEASPLFQTMRMAGFAVYSRQEIWRRLPGQGPQAAAVAPLTEETDADAMDIQLLYSNIVPRLVQPIAVPSSESMGLVFRQPGERIEGYVAVSEGKYGIYVVPYLHPDISFRDVSAILAGAIARSSRGNSNTPVYICVRRYQDWLEEALVELGFELWTEQAVMVRHITAGVRQASFAPLARTLDAMPSHVRPPTSQIVEPIVESNHKE